MDLLLDTHTLLWSLFDDEHLPKNIKNLIGNDKNTIFVSSASLWEIEIKHAKKPTSMPYDALDIYKAITTATDYIILPMKAEQIFDLSEIIRLNYHNDPFDHLLISIAKNTNATLITHDKILKEYKQCDIVEYWSNNDNTSKKEPLFDDSGSFLIN